MFARASPASLSREGGSLRREIIWRQVKRAQRAQERQDRAALRCTSSAPSRVRAAGYSCELLARHPIVGLVRKGPPSVSKDFHELTPMLGFRGAAGIISARDHRRCSSRAICRKAAGQMSGARAIPSSLEIHDPRSVGKSGASRTRRKYRAQGGGRGS